MDSSLVSTFTREKVRSAQSRDLSDELEGGKIVYFPECPIDLPYEEDLVFLREVLPGFLSNKNPSYHRGADRLYGVRGDQYLSARTNRVLSEHLRQVQIFLEGAIPELVPGWTIGSSSFRPVPELGRDLSRHKRSDLVHVDAGAYGATHGNRILRFFVNVNPAENRTWVSKGSFQEVYARYGRAAGVLPPDHQDEALREHWSDRVYSRLVRGLSSMGVPGVRAVDTSPYDRTMRKFHNWMKDTPSFQEAREGHREVSFPPFSAWMVFTDGISHACIGGSHAFIDTFIVPLENCRFPARAPFHLLQKRGKDARTPSNLHR